MQIRFAQKEDIDLVLMYDEHISPEELCSIISLQRVLVAENDNEFIGWLRWNLFWDNTPFMNMLFLLEEHRNKGYGKEIVLHWEKIMREKGYSLVMTSTLSNEEAQHFYRKLDYCDAGSLVLKGQPMEIIFTKEIQTIAL